MSTGHDPDFIGTSDRYKRNYLSRKSSAKSCFTIISSSCTQVVLWVGSGSTLKVSESINGPDQPLISPMRQRGQPPRWNLGFFFLVQDFCRFPRFLVVRVHPLACRGGVFPASGEGVGFLKFHCSCHGMVPSFPSKPPGTNWDMVPSWISCLVL